MKSIFFILIILHSCFLGNAQLTSLIVRNDTLFNVDPSTGTLTQLTRTLPDKNGHAGKILSNNGTNFNWQDLKTINGNSLIGIGDVTISTPDWSTIAGKPTTFTPSSHLHQQSDINNLVSDLLAKAPLVSPSLITPNIGAATGTSLSTTGNISSSGGGIGYTTGNGGAVTQTGNKGTAVTLNKLCGQITTTNAALAAAAEVSFNVNNSTVATNDVVVISIQGGGTVGSYVPVVSATGNGFFTVSIGNVSTGSLSQAVTLNFFVLKAVNN
jgi:hypothetical protein